MEVWRELTDSKELQLRRLGRDLLVAVERLGLSHVSAGRLDAV